MSASGVVGRPSRRDRSPVWKACVLSRMPAFMAPMKPTVPSSRPAPISISCSCSGVSASYRTGVPRICWAVSANSA
ncbi:hypothetical protein ACFFX0_09025 [Citricoccus parietis]|uniref:Uncharacterized protein n=1 Tax=Citricoccus parietis TaxID=592307 RepID=A0ABV5FXA5_9MICC